jgi:hypothetical protein
MFVFGILADSVIMPKIINWQDVLQTSNNIIANEQMLRIGIHTKNSGFVTENPIQQSAKTAGLAYLLIIVTSILSMIFGPYKLIVEGDTLATIDNIAANQHLFRAGATYDLLMFIGVIILSVALFNVLKTVNKTVALTALISRIGEALIGSLTIVGSIWYTCICFGFL